MKRLILVLLLFFLILPLYAQEYKHNYIKNTDSQKIVECSAYNCTSGVVFLTWGCIGIGMPQTYAIVTGTLCILHGIKCFIESNKDKVICPKCKGNGQIYINEIQH